jgi:periplasmic protein TonB
VIQIINAVPDDAKVCGEVSMFEFMKRDERPNEMRYFASLLLSITTHIVIVCLIVSVPLIFSNTHPEELVAWLIKPPALPAPIQPPAPPRAGSGAAKAAKAHGGPILVSEFKEPSKIPDGIHLEPPTADLDDYTGSTFEPPGGGDGVGIPSLNPQGRTLDRFLDPKRPTVTQPPLPVKPKPPIPVSSGVQESKLIHKVIPTYPELAIRARVQGTVILMATVDEDGNVADLKVLTGHILLKDAAVAAVMQWKYSPTILNGEPVPVQAAVNVIFTLK